MLSRLIIDNFRSIKHLDIPLGAINMFVGPNNSGKTTILEALNLLLGESYPSLRSFDDRDYHMHDTNSPISLTAFLDKPILIKDVFGKEHEAWGYQIQLDRYKRRAGRAVKGDPKFDYTMVTANGSTLNIVQRHPALRSKPFPQPVRVSSDHRDQFPLLFVGTDRSISVQLRGYQRTFMGRILRELDKDFRKDPSRVADFAEKMSEATEVLRNKTFQDFEQKFKDHVDSLTGLTDLTLGFRTFDPLDHYRLLELYVQETVNGLAFLPDELGSGTQSALAVALVRAYAQIVKEGAALVIEEPELYLHPHSCRYFKRALEEISSEGIQVFCSTHSPAFIDLGAYNNLYIVRRTPGSDTQISCGRNLTLAESDRERLRLESRFDTSRNEIFFARRVLLLEGVADKGAFKIIPELMKVDFDQEGISVLETGSKTAMLPVSKVLREFGIPHVCLVDEDSGKPTGEQLTKKIEESCGAENVFVMTPDLEGELGTSKLNAVGAMEHFMTFTDSSQVPEVMRLATQKVLSL